MVLHVNGLGFWLSAIDKSQKLKHLYCNFDQYAMDPCGKCDLWIY